MAPLCVSPTTLVQHNKRNQHKDTPDYIFFSIEPARYFGYKKVVARILLSLMMGYENHTIHVDDGKASSILPHLICCDGATELHTRRWDFKERVSLPTA